MPRRSPNQTGESRYTGNEYAIMNKFHTQKLAIQFVVFLAVLCLATSVDACPNCKNSVAQDSNAMAIGFAWSIALMLAVPLTIVSAWAIAIRRYCRRL